MGPVMVCMETHEASPAVRKAWGMPPFPGMMDLSSV